MYTFFVVIVSLFAGALLCGLGVFFFVIYRALQRLTAVTETLFELFQPIMKRETLQQWIQTFKVMSAQGSEIIRAVSELSILVRQLNKWAFNQQQPSATPAGEAPEGASWGGAPSDAALEAEEMAKELEKVGIRIKPPTDDDGEETDVPDKTGMRGAEV